MKKINRKDVTNAIFICFLATVLLLYSLIIIGMFVWAGYTSIKTPVEYSFSSYKLPTSVSFNNYVIAFRDIKVPITKNGHGDNADALDMILNSLIYTFGGATVSTLVPCVVSYCVAKYKYKFSKIIYFIVIMVMTLPVVGSQVSELSILHTLHLYNSYFGLFVLKFNFLGIYFLVFYAGFKSLPDTYVEASHIDGANDFAIFFRIMLPLVKTTIFIIFLLNAITYWNDITTSRVYLPSYPTFAYGLLFFSTEPGSSTTASASAPVRIAACMILVIPMLILFACFNKKMMGNLTMGGIKG